jgi:ATP-binding cassette, subfamily C, type I secretion system permease/ATPase
MFVLRILGFLLICGALGAAAYDSAHSGAIAGTWTTTLTDLWPTSHSEAFTERFRYAPIALDPSSQSQPVPVASQVLDTLKGLPLWLVLGAFGIALSLAGYRRCERYDPESAPWYWLAPVLRGCGLAILIAVTAVVILDLSHVTPSLRGVVSMTLEDLWRELDPYTLEALRNTLQRAKIWDPGVVALLRLSALLVAGLMGFTIYRMGARRSPPRQFSSSKVTEPPQDEQTPTLQKTEPSPPSKNQTSLRSEVSQALSTFKSALLSIGLFSGFSNVLMLTGAFFMLQIYDRVLPSRSVPTLVALAILAGMLFAFLALLDMIRSRMLVRVGRAVDGTLSPRVYETIVRAPLKLKLGAGLQPLRDLDAVRSFLSSPGPIALFDLPWLPLYLGIIFAFHTALGVTALIGALILISLTLLTEIFARRSMKDASTYASARHNLAEASRRNAEVVASMGMAGRLGSYWAEANQNYLASSQKVSDVAAGFGSVSKALRMMLQSAMLGIGAYLVIHQQATAGIIIAASILIGRALAPVDLAIGNWKGFLGARQGWKRLSDLLRVLPAQAVPMALPPPRKNLTLEHASAVPPGEKKVVVQGVNFSLNSGQGLGIVGPTGSGKSSLIRVIVGAWQPARGRIQLDGAALDQWSPDQLGHHIGYLPQDVELFAGTVAQNIARFDRDADPQAIIAAAQAAGVHDLIVDLPQGYDTQIGEQGQVLSAGQRQRIALARALYGDPFLVVLDEPNSNLDGEGEAALMQAVADVRNRGGIVILAAHRPNVLISVDLILVLSNGTVTNFGPRDEVLSKVLVKRPVARPSLSVVQDVGAKS